MSRAAARGLWGTGYIMTRGNWLVSRLAGSSAALACVASRHSHPLGVPSPHLRLSIHHHSRGRLAEKTAEFGGLRHGRKGRPSLYCLPRDQTSVETAPRASGVSSSLAWLDLT